MGKLPTYNSGFETEDFDNYAIDGFSELLIDSPLSYSIDVCNYDLTVIKTIKAIIQNNSSDTSTKSTERQLLSGIGEIILGKYIKYKNKYYLVISYPDNNKIYEKSIIKQCNYNFKWQNYKGEILTRPSIVLNASQYNSGIEENKIMTLGSNQYMVYLPLDSETLELTYEKRVFIDNNYKTPYEITRHDNVSNSYNGEGLIILILSQDVLSERDRPDLGICDYFEPNVQPSTTCEITYLNSPIVYIGGKEKTFKAVFKDAEGNILTDVSAIWSTDITDADQSKILFEDKGNNTCTLKAVNDLSLIGKNIRLSLTTLDNQYETYLNIVISGVM